MKAYPEPMQRCMEALKGLPGIGEKSAQRILFHLLDSDRETPVSLANAISDLAESVELCPSCRVYKQKDTDCLFCSDSTRNPGYICVVESAADLYLVEATAEYRGGYHVLHGLLSPMKGLQPERMGLSVLEKRLSENGVEELILATPPTSEGEATASFLASRFASIVRRISRIAYGMPVGADFQYVDSQTLSRALTGRRSF